LTSTIAANLRIPHCFLTDRQHHAKNVFEHRTLTDLDVCGHRHAGADGETGRDVVECDPINRNPRAIKWLGACGQHGERGVRIAGLVLRREGIRAEGTDGTMGETVLRIGEGVELYSHWISDMHEAAAAAYNVCPDLERRVDGH